MLRCHCVVQARSLLERNVETWKPLLLSDACVAVLLVVPTMSATAVLLSVCEEGWTLLDGLYFCLITGTSLGMDGVLEPRTPLGRACFCLWLLAVLGPTIFILGVIGDVAKRQGARVCAILGTKGAEKVE